MSIYGNPVMLGGSGGGGGGGDDIITPVYEGLSYGSVSLGGAFQSGTANSNYVAIYELAVGNTYLFAVGAKVSNRLRAAFYYGKSYSADFQTYVEEASSAVTTIYTASLPITGSIEATGDGLMRRYYVTPQTSGVLVVDTSNVSVVAPIYLIKIPAVSIVSYSLAKGSYNQYNGTLTLVDEPTKEYSFIFQNIYGVSGYVEYASIDTGDNSSLKNVTFNITGNWKDYLIYGSNYIYCYETNSPGYATNGLAIRTEGTYSYRFSNRYLCWSFGNVSDSVSINCNITGLRVTSGLFG